MIEQNGTVFRITLPNIPGNGDIHQVTRMSAVQGFVITAATRHLEAIGASAEVVMQRLHAFWVLSRMRVEMLAPLPCRGDVEVVTRGADPHGAGFQREAEIFFEGECVARVASLWCLTEVETRKLLRPSAVCDALDLKTTGAPIFPTPARLRLPSRDTEPFLHTVRYSDIDMNRHLHSARYTDICLDALGLENEPAFVRSCQLNYHMECAPGEVLSIYSEREGNTARLCGTGSSNGKLRFEAEFVFEQL